MLYKKTLTFFKILKLFEKNMLKLFLVICLFRVLQAKCLYSKYFWTEEEWYENHKFLISYFGNFNKYSDLEMVNCSQTYNVTSCINFLPKAKLILDKTFVFKKLIGPNRLPDIKSVVMSNLKGIDLNSLRLFEKKDNYIKESTALTLIFSKLNIYSNGQLINNVPYNCITHIYNNTNYFLSSFMVIYFRHVIYPKSICPLLFRDSRVEYLYFTDITNSLYSDRTN